ncbi:cytochrome c oxidase subunit II [Chromatiales bacterium (ex Bugula neritina AB1)]|nr:cytochrome c oxidase subunit II [Chromatiales bacterium (ex Bugula neritina AB1)]
MPVGVTPISQEVYGLHMLIFWICCVIGALVFAVMFYSIYMHRKSKGAKAADFHESTLVEIIWTAVPLIILVAMAIPAARTLIAMEDTSNAEVTVKVTGYQWKWHYEYLDSGVSFFSTLDPDHAAARKVGSGVDVSKIDHYLKEVDEPLVLPVGKKVRFLHTASDVIHSWWVPDLAVKKDAIPGFINENWALIEKEGVYRGKCAELCGRDHGFMPIVVNAVSEEEFEAWIAERTPKETSTEDDASTSGAGAVEEDADREWAMDELMAKGETVYGAACAACHQAEGQGIPGAFPAIAGSPIATGPADAHTQTVFAGVAGTGMAAFANQLSDVEMAAVLTYQRNAFGNTVGDTIQPSAIKALR